MAQGSKRLLRGSRSRGVWECRVFIGRDPVSGKQRYKSKTARGGVGDADEALRKLLDEVGAGKHDASDTTVRHLSTKWLAHIERVGRSPTTLREYKRLIEKRIKPVLGDVPLSKLDPETLDSFYGRLAEDKLSPASIRQVHAILRAACRQAEKWGWLSSNPASRATPPPVHQKPKAVPLPSEVKAMIAAAEEDDTDMAALIALAATTGARRGELLGLRWGDLDLQAGTLTIERSVAVIGRHNLVVKPTKTHAVRRLALDDFAIEVLRRQRAELDSRADDLGTIVTDDTPVLTYDLERPIAPDTATHYVRRVADKAGVDCHLHQLRHFAATQLVGGGHDVRTVAGRLGHANANTTLKVYAHALPERDRAAAAALGAALRPSRPGPPRRQGARRRS